MLIHFSLSQSHLRRYATEPPKAGSSGNVALYSGLGLIGVGGGYYTLFGGRKDPVTTAMEQTEPKQEDKKPEDGGPPNKVFKGGEQVSVN